MQTEKATYDPDLPHEFLAGRERNECDLCQRNRKDELHQMEMRRQRADTTLLVTEKGS